MLSQHLPGRTNNKPKKVTVTVTPVKIKSMHLPNTCQKHNLLSKLTCNQIIKIFSACTESTLFSSLPWDPVLTMTKSTPF